MEIQEHYPLAQDTTFKIGGSVRFFTEVHTADTLAAAFAYGTERSIPTVLIGGGSNTLLDDGEAEVVVIKPTLRGSVYTATGCVVAAGEVWDQVVVDAVERGLHGIENLSGIPGSMGGAVVQNIGAYGASLSEVVEWVEVYDTVEARIRQLPASACTFGYRDSIFKRQQNRFVVMRVALSLSVEKKLNTTYRDLATYFAGAAPTLSAVREAVLTIRRGKFPDLSVEGTAGSFFKNPIVSLEVGGKLQEQYPQMPLFSLPEASGYKVPLAWILDHVLSLRGFALGPARCFEKQPLVLVAERHAHARDVRALALEVQTRVYKETHIMIEPEVCVMRGAEIAHTLNF